MRQGKTTGQSKDRTLLRERLQALTNTAKYDEAIRLYEDIDVDAEQDAGILYHAGVCFGAAGHRNRAVDLLHRAARAGFEPFWCAYHLGLVQMRAGKLLDAAHCLSIALVLRPERSDIYPLFDRIAPNLDFTLLHTLQGTARGSGAASAAFELGAEEQRQGNLAGAVHYLTLALVWDPEHEKARSRLLTLVPDLLIDLVTAIKEHSRAPEAVEPSAKADEIYDLLVKNYNQCTPIWQDALSDDEKNRLSKACLVVAARLSFSSGKMARRIFKDAEQFGAHFLPVHFYSPIPARKDINQSVYQQRYDTIPGLKIDHESHLKWLARLAPYSKELERFPDDSPAGDETFFWNNPAFGPGDAATYYTLIRELKPAKIIEVGSGYSSLVAVAALKENGKGSLTCIEPYPLPHLRRLGERGDIQLIERRLQDVPLEMVSDLTENDIFFVDSSHVCKIGSDVNHVVFQMLPKLQAGVFCHFHDLFFPFEFPKHWIEDLQLFWNEQYLVMAFLAFNTKFKIEISGQCVAREIREAFRARFPDLPARLSAGGGSLWISVSS
jgi:tetratricopeptide (TPR) repeat protein